MSQEAANVIPPSAVGRCDPTAWVEQHGDYLFRYALIRVRNESVAEDLVQNALLATFQGKERFTGSSTERSWLTGILKHKIMDHFRRLARERPVNADDSLPSELADRFDEFGLWKHHPDTGPAAWESDAAALIQEKEFMAALKECLSKLPPRSADAFVLSEMESVESEDIQKILGMSRFFSTPTHILPFTMKHNPPIIRFDSCLMRFASKNSRTRCSSSSS